MEDFWNVGKTPEKQGIDKMKGDIKGAHKYVKAKVDKRKKFMKISIEKANARAVIDFMNKKGIEYKL